MKKPSARVLVTFAITMVVLSLHLAGTFIGLLPDSDAIRRDGRASLAEALAVRTVRHLANSEVDILEEGLTLILARNPDLLSAAVRRADGNTLISLGEHQRFWTAADQSRSTDSQLTVPIMEGGRQWGQLELRFEPLRRSGWWGIVDSPLAQYSLFLALVGFISLYFVLGRMLRHLDPAKAVPARVRSALDTMMEGLLAIDLKGQIVLANQAFADIAGETHEALLGKRINHLDWQLTPDDTHSEARFPWEITLSRGLPGTSSPIHFIDGESKRRTFLVNCSPVMGGEGDQVGVLVGLGDVTELEEKEIELRLSKDRAEAANRAKSEFLANMSHEIRTPMNAILGFTEMLKSSHTRSEEENRKYLNTIHTSGKFLLEVVNDLLDISKIEAGSLELERVHCPVHEVVREVLDALSVKAEERGIELKFECDTPVPATIETDPLRLRQVITNLVGNSIKFTENGSVCVGLRYDAEANPHDLFIDVADTGIGMTPEQVEKVFDPFVQADRTITRRFGGTGLGLSISKRFAEALGGDIEVRSTMGVGSVFTVRIDTGSMDGVPLLGPEEAHQTKGTRVEETLGSWDFRRSRVLVADDTKQNRDLLNLFLSEHGLKVTGVENGAEAVEAARETDFDVILMDLEMPIMNGVDATRAIRSEGVDVPIIALSAHSLQSVKNSIQEAGFTEFINKPVDINNLLKRLAEILGAEQVAPRVGSTQAEARATGSNLPVGDVRYQQIVDDFVNSLELRITKMDAARREHDFDSLGKLLHSLKGLAGSVGFDSFTPTIERLEAAVRSGSSTEIDQQFETLKAIVRCAIEGSDSTARLPVIATASNVECLVGPPIRSSLPVAEPAYRKILFEFIDELEGRFDAMERALGEADYSNLSQLAHAFIGVAGMVGFVEFTEPARKLEAAAQALDRDDAIRCITALRVLGSRVEKPAATDVKQTSTVISTHSEKIL